MKVLFFIFFASISSFCFGQTYVYNSDENIIAGSHISTTPGEPIKITDRNTKMFFVLDSTHTTIEAFNESGEFIWKTNPHTDNKLSTYRTNKPYIVYFDLTDDYWCAEGFVEKGTPVIAISYVNTQFGVLKLETGEFRFCGQD